MPLSALVYTAAGVYATVEGTSSITYTIWDVATKAAVPGHSGVSLTPAAVLSDTIESDALAASYNFRHQPSQSLGQPFPTPGQYAIAYTFTPTSGSPFWVNFMVTAEW